MARWKKADTHADNPEDWLDAITAERGIDKENVTWEKQEECYQVIWKKYLKKFSDREKSIKFTIRKLENKASVGKVSIVNLFPDNIWELDEEDSVKGIITAKRYDCEVLTEDGELIEDTGAEILTEEEIAAYLFENEYDESLRLEEDTEMKEKCIDLFEELSQD